MRTDKRRNKRDARTADVLGKGLIAALAASKRPRTENTITSAATTSSSAAAKKAATGSKTQPVGEGVGAVKSLPANFSRVNMDLPFDVLQQQYPLYTQLLERGGAVDVVLKAGQMLYIPAGWFHEVRSRGADNSVAGESETDEYSGHMALNFWFHPPDNDACDKPYKSDFWKKDFEARMKDGK